MTTQQIKKGVQQLGSNWAEWVIKRKWLVLFLSVLVVAGFGMGLPKVAFDGDYRVFFSKENPQLNAFDALQNKYTQDDNVLILVEPREGETFSKDALAAIEELTTTVWNTPYSSRVDAITNFQHTYAKGDDLYVEDLVEEASGKSENDILRIKDIALKEPLLVNRLLSNDGRVSAVNVTIKLPGASVEEGPEVVAFIRETVQEFERDNPDLKTYLSGMVMLNSAFFEAAQKDSGTLIPLMFLAIIITILIATRTVSGTFATLVIIIFSIFTAMGFAGLMGIKLTPPSGSAPIIIMTLAVADSIHILITLVQSMQKGMTKKEAIVESLRVNFMPVFITSLTTVIGFLSMNTSDVPPFHDLGNITAVGMGAAFLFSVTTLPALMTVLPLRIKVKEETTRRSSRIFEGLSNFIIRNDKKIVWGSAALIILLTFSASRNQLNDEFINYFDSSIAFRTDTDFISENLTGIYNVEFSVGAGESGGINNPEYLQNLENFEYWLEDQPEVVHVNSFAEVARRVNRSMHGDSTQYYRVPGNREEAAQYLLLYEMSLPFGLDLNNQINVDKSETRVTVTVQNLSSIEMIDFAKRAENWLVENTPEYMHATGTSPSLMFSYLSGRQIRSMISGTVLALIIISVILMLALRSFGFGFLSLVPNLTPIAAGFGVWAMSSGIINVGMAIVFGMTLGIIVDDTVHYMSKYLRARREHNETPEGAVRYAFSTVGRALVVTTVVLLIGFAILSQSSFLMNSAMAQITTIIILSALILDFLMLPAILLMINKRQKNMIPQAAEVAEHQKI